MLLSMPHPLLIVGGGRFIISGEISAFPWWGTCNYTERVLHFPFRIFKILPNGVSIYFYRSQLVVGGRVFVISHKDVGRKFILVFCPVIHTEYAITRFYTPLFRRPDSLSW